MKKHIFLLIPLFLISCKLSDFQTVFEADIPKKTPSIVLNAFITDDSVFSITLTESQYILSTGSFTPVLNASVRLYKDNLFVEPLQDFFQTGKYWGNFFPEKGAYYRIEVTKEGYNPITSQDIMPEIHPSIKKITTKIVVGTGGRGGNRGNNIEYGVIFNDLPKDTYYQISFAKYQYNYDTQGTLKDSTFTYYTIRPVDTNVTNQVNFSAYGIIFTDEFFKNKETEITFRAGANVYRENTQNTINTKDSLLVTIYLKSISKNLYNYIQTSNLQDNNNADFFSEPVLVYDNIQNGFGIFGSYLTDSQTILIKNPTK